MKLTRNPDYRTSPGGNTHQPKRPFFKLATTALVAGLSFVPMALPKHAVAQDVKPVADTSVTITKSNSPWSVWRASRRQPRDTATQEAKPVIDTVVQDVKPTMDASAQKAKPATPAPAPKLTDFSFLRFMFGTGVRFNPIREMRNVPLEIRHIPVYPDDIWKGHSSGFDTSWSRPMNGTIKLPSDVKLLFGFNLGPGFSFNNGRFEIEFGAGADLSIFTCRLIERNYLKNDRATAGDSLNYERVAGTALTWYTVVPRFCWYTIAPHCYRKGLSRLGISPYLSTEMRLKNSKNFVIGLGYLLSKEDYVSRSGWDRYDSYAIYRQFDLVDLTVGTPYLLFGIATEYDNRPLTLGFYFGFRHIIKKQLSDLAKQAELGFRDFACIFGITSNWPLLPE